MAAKKKAKKAAKKPAKKAAKKAAKKVEAVPSRYGTATAHLVVSPAKDALKFYEKAFGAKVFPAMKGPGGVIMHGEIQIGDSIIMLADEMPPMPGQTAVRKSPKNAGATTGGVMLYVKDVDAAHKRAVEAGAQSEMPPMDMFWGDRYCQVIDPFGHTWSIATHLRDMTAKEMAAAMEEAAKQMGGGAPPNASN